MKTLYSIEEFKNSKTFDKLPLECYQCNNTFYQTKHFIKRALNPNQSTAGKYCSHSCSSSARRTLLHLNCKECNKPVSRVLNQTKKSKNTFCSHSCSVIFSNKNKTFGTNRSKLEILIEEKLKENYPHLEIIFNDSSLINYELDIYIPKLKLAFEINGIFHYQPIFGDEKFERTKYIDSLKNSLCSSINVNLITLDTTEQKKFTLTSSYKYLNIIYSSINKLL